MTLLRAGLAFLAVAVLFVAFAWGAGGKERGNAVAPAAEALVLTLLAALWFSSLGHGGWVPVFFLIGVLVAVSGRRAEREGRARWLIVTAVTALRYLLAGGLIAVILG